jgi:hypothetical protein
VPYKKLGEQPLRRLGPVRHQHRVCSITGSPPPVLAGVATGLRATTREFGSALAVALIGTALATTTPGRVHDVIGAFISGTDLGLRVVGVTVFARGGLTGAMRCS